jgi:hypothetical protein
VRDVGSLVFGLNDFELLHFYTAHTSVTVSTIPERQAIWQHVIPPMAFTHHFLLYGLLAFSALHLARVQPERKVSLFAQASSYHEIGLRLFRVAILDINRQNCDACFAYASILVVYTWASSDQTGDLFFSAAGGSINTGWAPLLRGVHSLISVTGDWIATGALGVMLYPFSMDLKLAIQANAEVSAKLTALRTLWSSPNTKFSPADVKALKETLALLHEAHGLMISSSEQCPVDLISIVLAWPIRLPEAFLIMVNQQIPEALVVLAHYSLLLSKVEHVWFIQGMRSHLLRMIQDRVGVEWESWILWLL